MHSVEYHIKYLLYTRANFIIPNLGYFYSKYFDSVYSPDEGVLRPREKKYFFDGEVTSDYDSFLVGYIANREGILLEDSEKKVNDYIFYVIKTIETQKKCNFLDIGYFYYSDLKIVRFNFIKEINFNLNTFGFTNKDIAEVKLYIDEDNSSEEREYTPRNYDERYLAYYSENTEDMYYGEKGLLWTKGLKYALFMYLLVGGWYFIDKGVGEYNRLNKGGIYHKSEILNFSFITRIFQQEIVENEVYHVVVASFDQKDIAKVKRFIKKFESQNPQYKLSLMLDSKIQKYRIVCATYTDREQTDRELKQIRNTVSDAWVYITYLGKKNDNSEGR